MDDSPQPPPPPPREGETPVLGYAGPDDEASQRAPFGQPALVPLIAVGWFFAMMIAGVSADRIHIPLAKKVVLTAGAVAIAAALSTRRSNARIGCLMWFVLGALCALGVMWFWN